MDLRVHCLFPDWIHGKTIAIIHAPFKIACQIIESQPNVGGIMAGQLVIAMEAGTKYGFSRYTDVLSLRACAG